MSAFDSLPAVPGLAVLTTGKESKSGHVQRQREQKRTRAKAKRAKAGTCKGKESK